MKYIILILTLFFLISFSQAEISDPELVNYLDTAFPSNYSDGLIVVARFNWEYDSETFKDMVCSLVAGLSDDVLSAFSDSAVSMFQETFGAIPSNNWSVVLDINSQEVKKVFRAKDIESTGTQDESGRTVYNASLNSNQSGGMWSYSNMTGQTLAFENTVPVLDEEGNETGETKNELEHYKVAAAVNWSPIIIDMDMDGKPDTNRNVWLPHAPTFYEERVAKFDMSGDGLSEFAEWLGTKDGLLALPEADGSIKSALNLFGNAGGYKDGYQKMATLLDLDGNGWVEKDELKGLHVWRDLNGNAKVDKGEMQTVQELGIEKIKIAHKNFESICIIKGKEVKTWDWWPACYELIKHKKNR